jgi:Protein of unknown function (DUF3016)
MIKITLMKTRLFATLSLVVGTVFFLGCQTPPPSNGVTADAITVNFSHPDKYTDFTDRLGGPPSDSYSAILLNYLKSTAPAYLQAGQKLTVTFTDIDLAGDFLPSTRSNSNQIRVVKPIYRPRMEINFQLTGADGKTLKEGQRTLMDMNFQMDQPASVTSGDRPLFYDTQLLLRWLQTEFK